MSLTYIYSNFENTFFGLSNLELFIESLYASNLCLHAFYIYIYFSFIIIIIIIIIITVCVFVLYVRRPFWETYKISSRFESCFVFAF